MKPVTPKIDHVHKLFEYIGGDIRNAFPGAYRQIHEPVPLMMESGGQSTSLTLEGSIDDAILKLLPNGHYGPGGKIEVRLVLAGQCTVTVGDQP